jgi:hypothetical protein
VTQRCFPVSSTPTSITLSASESVLDDYLAARDRGLDALTARAAHNLQAALSAGVTTVRDCGTLNESPSWCGPPSRLAS